MEQPVPMALGGMGETALSRYYLHSGERDSPLVPGPPLPSAHNPGTLPAPRGGRAPPPRRKGPRAAGPPRNGPFGPGVGPQNSATPSHPVEPRRRRKPTGDPSCNRQLFSFELNFLPHGFRQPQILKPVLPLGGPLKAAKPM